MRSLILTLTFISLAYGIWAQKIYTVAGNGNANFTGDSVEATLTGLTPDGAVAIDSTGNMYFADVYNNRIRKVNAGTGIITTIAGTGVNGYNGDGILAVNAQVNHAMVVAVDRWGNLYIGDYSNNRIRKIDAFTGIISTIAGTGGYGYSGDSLSATSSMITEVTGITVDYDGNIFFSDMGNSRIRKIDIATGKLCNIAGTGNIGYNGDNIPADQADLNFPYGIAVDNNGNVYFADKDNYRVREINTSTGIITTVAGTGFNSPYSGNGIPAVNANLHTPKSVAVNNQGDLYIAAEGFGIIYKVDHLNGTVLTVAGAITGGTQDDNVPATSAFLDQPRGVSVDNCGNIYISSYGLKKIKKVFSYDLNLVIVDAGCYGTCDGQISVNATGGVPPYDYQWNNLGSGTSFTGLCSGTYVLTVTDDAGCSERLPVNISQPQEIQVSFSVVNPTCHADGSISVSVGGINPIQYLWSTGGTQSAVNGLNSGTYSITITDATGCTKADTVILTNISTSFNSAPVCMVTVDSLSHNNIIIWDKTTSANADSFIIYREINTNNYQPIGQVSYNQLSQFTDTVRTLYFPNTGDPNTGTYRYKLQVLDSCGGYSDLSPYHNTVFILNNGSGIFYWTLPYSIENEPSPVTNYELLRDDLSNGNWHVINSVAGTQQTITDPLYVIYENTASWRVRTVWSISCTPAYKNSTENFSNSLSNIYSNNTSAVNHNKNDNNVIIYPNPAVGTFVIETDPFLYIHDLTLEFCTVEGKVIFNQVLDKSVNVINVNQLSGGVYIAKIKSNNFSEIRKIILR